MGKTRDTANLISDGNLSVDITNDRIGIGTTNPNGTLQVGAASTQAFTILSDGVVVIGGITTSSSGRNPLTIRSAGIASTIPNILVSPDTTTNAALIQFSNAGSGSLYFGRTNSGGKTGVFDLAPTGYVDFIGNSGTLPLAFVTGSNERMRINTGGSVGIGTTNPTSKLHTIGDVLIVGIITATSYRGDGSQLTGISAENDITSCLFT